MHSKISALQATRLGHRAQKQITGGAGTMLHCVGTNKCYITKSLCLANCRFRCISVTSCPWD